MFGVIEGEGAVEVEEGVCLGGGDGSWRFESVVEVFVDTGGVGAVVEGGRGAGGRVQLVGVWRGLAMRREECCGEVGVGFAQEGCWGMGDCFDGLFVKWRVSWVTGVHYNAVHCLKPFFGWVFLL